MALDRSAFIIPLWVRYNGKFYSRNGAALTDAILKAWALEDPKKRLAKGWTVKNGSIVKVPPFAIIGRSVWGAKPPKHPLIPIEWTSRTTTYVHHSVTNEPTGLTGAALIEAEKAHMRLLQQIAFDRGFSDISYCYIIFKSGRVYEGRGKHVGAHTLGHNEDLGVCFAGNYEIDKLTEEQEEALANLRKKLGISGLTKAHCSVYSTACPGKNVRAALGLTCGTRSAEAPEEPQDHEEGDISLEDAEKKVTENELVDEQGEESFPASDPPGNY
jgi:hypothetical protein